MVRWATSIRVRVRVRVTVGVRIRLPLVHRASRHFDAPHFAAENKLRLLVGRVRVRVRARSRFCQGLEEGLG